MASKSRSRRNTAGRGFVNNTILECLLDGDKYGYEIIKEVKEKTDGKVVLKEPSLYSSLKRFEQKGYISSYWGDSDIGGRRHYYSLTEPGRKYFLNLKSPKDVSIDDIEPEQNSAEQISIDNINEEIYNIEEDNVDVDDNSYINNVSFNVADRMNELLNENQEVYNSASIELQPITESTDNVFVDHNESVEETLEEKELIDEITSAINEENPIKDDFKKQNIETQENQEYLFDHKFRNTTNEVSNGKEKYVQYDLFTNIEQANYVDTPTLQPKETIAQETKEKITANKSEIELEKEIPLFEENEVEFFNWNELKRQAVTNKTSFSNRTVEQNKYTNKYSLNSFEDEKEVETPPKESTYKTTNDLHKLFNHTTKETANSQSQQKTFDNLSPSNTQNKIFDNVKDRIELNDAVLGSKKEIYNDEPELTPEEIERLNKNFNEKFNQIAESKINNRDLDYKKILGDLYYQDIPKETVNYIQPETYFEEEIFENSEDFFDNSSTDDFATNYEEFVDNDIEDEKIVSAINKSKIYSYNTLKESLSNDGFKFKPYSIGVPEDDTEQFVKINKVKFVYGAILSAIMLLQILGVFICLKTTNLIYVYDIALYIVAIIASIATFVYYLIPYISKKDERKIKFYNLNYHLMFGVLYLICGLVLTYAVNLIFGLNSANVTSFLSRLILPAIMLTNFIISPIVYKLVMESKNIK